MFILSKKNLISSHYSRHKPNKLTMLINLKKIAKEFAKSADKGDC